MLGPYLTGFQNGDIQQQRQILIGGVQVEHDALAVVVELDLRDVGEAALVEVALLRRLIGGQNVVGRYPGPVGEPGVVIHIKRIDRVVGIDPIPGAENGCGLITAVVGEEALIHQGEQHPVGKVHADDGIHGPVGIIGQDHGLIRQGILLCGVRVILHKDGIPRGHISAVLFRGTAGNECRQRGKHQQKGKQSLHFVPPLHTITAPWLPR